MIKEIFDNSFFLCLLYLIGILFFIKIDPYSLPQCVTKFCYHPLILFIILLIIMFISSYCPPLGLFGATIYLYFFIINYQNKVSFITENFQNNQSNDEEDDNDEDDNDDDDDDTEEELEKMEEEVKKEEEEESEESVSDDE